MIFVMMGMQGSGKGTQANFLSKLLDLEHISLGERFRKDIFQKTELGNLVQQYLSKGQLVPDSIVMERIEHLFAKKNNGFVFDGFPRTIPQAEYLTKKHPIRRVFYLVLNDEMAINRMLARRICTKCKKDYNLLVNSPHIEGQCDLCGSMIERRADDTPELIKNRLELFHQETAPLIHYYKQNHLLSSINAVGDIQLINKKILKEIIINSK